LITTFLFVLLLTRRYQRLVPGSFLIHDLSPGL
jgi:hypothetical protein